MESYIKENSEKIDGLIEERGGLKLSSRKLSVTFNLFPPVFHHIPQHKLNRVEYWKQDSRMFQV